MRTFRDFMESALYDPKRGFYPARTKTADFYTAPELHPAFGAVLADRLASLLERVRADRPGEGLTLVEAGGGDGTLAAQVVRRLRETGNSDGLRLILIERSRRDLTAAARTLTAFGVPVEALTSVERLPRVTGVIYSNELFDAMPAHLLRRRGERVLEAFVNGDGREVLGEPSSPQLAAAAAAVAPALADGQAHAVCLEAPRWLTLAAERLSAGFVLTADYGKRFGGRTPNPPRAYRRHRLEEDLLSDPGEKDLTVPADFETLMAAGARAGLETQSYQSLSRFLVEGGVESWLAAAAGDNAASFKERAQIKTLLHPEGMGEAFKVLIQRKLP